MGTRRPAIHISGYETVTQSVRLSLQSAASVTTMSYQTVLFSQCRDSATTTDQYKTPPAGRLAGFCS